MNSLQGMFLIATNQMVDSRFKHTVILICSHDKNGALGLVLTNPYEHITMLDIIKNLGVRYSSGSYPAIYCGGPVDLDTMFYLHPQQIASLLPNSTEIMEDVFWGNFSELMSYIEQNKEMDSMRFFLGYSGWGPGQLEQELSVDGWLVLPGSAADVFSCHSLDLWRSVTSKNGINIDLFADISTSA